MSSKAPCPVQMRPEWDALRELQIGMRGQSLARMLNDEPTRFDDFHAKFDGVLFDYSKHLVNVDVMGALFDLARACDVEGLRDRMVAGDVINGSENRSVLHMALRGSCGQDLSIDGESVSKFVDVGLSKIEAISEAIRSNPQITDVINIGIGGSDLGPRMMCKALRPFADGPNIYFISNIDGSALHQRLAGLKPENTAFIIATKTFATAETMSNARVVQTWIKDALGQDGLQTRMFAVTCNEVAAIEFGVLHAHIVPMRDWIGGRMSIWGGVGLSVAVRNGFAAFQDFLAGARAMDTHFLNAPLEENLPVIMAMIGIWYRNFWDYSALAVLPYSHDLREFPIFLQQLEMESNGKAAGIATSPVIFGEAGTNAQHTFMQMMHQSASVIPADFIVFAKTHHPYAEHHDNLLGHALAQSRALALGLENVAEPHRHFPGNRPSSTLVLDQLDAYHMGMLIALYEHKVFVQGAVWGINSFDQWGVELGKDMAKGIIQAIGDGRHDDLDGSTVGLLKYLSEKST